MVLSSDRRQVISLWNIRKRKVVFQRHLSEIVGLDDSFKSVNQLNKNNVSNCSKFNSFRYNSRIGRPDLSSFTFIKNKSYEACNKDFSRKEASSSGNVM